MGSIDISPSYNPSNNMECLCMELMSSITKRWSVYRKCTTNPNWIADHYAGGITEPIFSRYIMKSRKSLLLRGILPLIIDSVIDESITDDIFSLLYSYEHKRTKDQMLISLSHKHLPAYLLRKLCETNRCFECYFELITKIYQDDVYSADDVQEAINCFLKSPFSGMIRELMGEMEMISTKNFEKKKLLEVYVQLYADA